MFFVVHPTQQKSLPLLRQSLVTKEITIEGINPPSTAVAFGTTALSQIPVSSTQSAGVNVFPSYTAVQQSN